jgi:hypothetical protein
LVPRRAIAVLVITGLVLPIVVAVTTAAARLLVAMQDLSGGAALDRIALAAGMLWAVDLISLVVVLGINSLPPRPGE